MAKFTPSAVHLKLSQRKALAARLAFARHLNFAELPACDQDALNELTKFSRLITDPANDIDEATVQNGRLDWFLSEIAKTWMSLRSTLSGRLETNYVAENKTCMNGSRQSTAKNALADRTCVPGTPIMTIPWSQRRGCALIRFEKWRIS
jgi:hypothetical protein